MHRLPNDWPGRGDPPVIIQLQHIHGALMWILDDDVITDITPGAAAYAHAMPGEIIGTAIGAGPSGEVLSVMDLDVLGELRQLVRDTGQANTVTNWVCMTGDKWHKLIQTTTQISAQRLLVVAHDVTHLDPKARWLSRIDCTLQRLQLRADKYLTFAQYSVLYHRARGHKKCDVAKRLNISRSAVNNREAGIKTALGVTSMAEAMDVITRSGLISLLTLELRANRPSPNALALYRKMADFPLDPRVAEPPDWLSATDESLRVERRQGEKSSGRSHL
jgi:DNA-binding NarL/FixJ family response regulator